MEDFKPEDELKPDTSDRRPTRQRKVSTVAKFSFSRQHLMMAVGILVLLLLVLGIGAALTTPASQPSGNTQTAANATLPGNGSRSINLSGSSSMTTAPSVQGNTSEGHQQISFPAVSPTPTQAAVLPEPANQQRVEVPGDLNRALENVQDQEQLNTVAQGAQNSLSSLPTAAATVASPGARTGSSGNNKPASVATNTAAPKEPARIVTRAHPEARRVDRQSHATAPSPASSQGASTPLKGEYTLQLSGASQAESQQRWAKNQQLTNYHVYKTERNGQPWYVLISGAYATPAEAKRAVAALPAEVKAQQPWVKSVSQVKKEIKK
ncbi:MAG: Cell division protein DamX [Candidatus Erwinia impunctatus]|nr:Cell division protein DamX [Culicoides impunctatus]